MSESEKKQRRQRRSFNLEFKAGAVKLVLEEGKSVAAVARDLDLTETALRKWVEQAKTDKRRERAAARAALPSPQVHHPVPPEERACPRCGGTELKPLGRGKRSVLYEYVPPSPEGACASCAAPLPLAPTMGFPSCGPACCLATARAGRAILAREMRMAC